jgi:hypothetical protein
MNSEDYLGILNEAVLNRCDENRRKRQETGQFNMEDLTTVAMEDVLVNHVLNAWRMGCFPTFEAALIALVCVQAKDRRQLQDQVIKLMQRVAKPISVPKAEQ